MMKRTLFVAAGAALIVSSLSGVAVAHPAYKDSDPKAGATVPSPPTELWIQFTESIEQGTIAIVDPCGERVDHGEEEMNITSDRLTKGMHGDKSGAYLVKWEVLGSDSHITRGEFSFTSSEGNACPVADDDTDKDPPANERDDRDSWEVSDDDRTAQTTEADDSKADRRPREARKPRHERHRRAAKDRVGGKQLFAQEESPEVEETSAPGIWDGIPMGDYLIALGVAAAIGAAGGRIYAGILGPRR